jgi:hypothetical protein
MQEGAVKLYSQEYQQYDAVADITMENNGSEDEGVDKLATMIKGMNEKNDASSPPDQGIT